MAQPAVAGLFSAAAGALLTAFVAARRSPRLDVAPSASKVNGASTSSSDSEEWSTHEQTEASKSGSQLAVASDLAALAWARKGEFAPAAVDGKDVGTPDEWVPRHPDLVRLTGRHPFNCEPPLTKLLDAGAVTARVAARDAPSIPRLTRSPAPQPAAIHYVRNHGAAPKREWATHTVTVSGPFPSKTYSMDELVALPSHTLPVLLVCAGNRRKEENMVKQTIGFSWGPAGLGNSLWTGVPLWRLLHAAGVTAPTPSAQYVRFAGPSGELPKGADGSYGTSIPMWMALDPGCDVTIAYEQNGARLAPDHGFPVRLIVPGWIGGRMVKWLSSIEVSSEPSTNHYHYMDNRILPPEVDAERAASEGWWFKQEYIFNELNINSAIGSPAHGEVLPLKSGASQPYVLRGYAYTGGGRAITRAEVSLDDGATWQLAELQRPFAPTARGKHWAWSLWKLGIDARALLLAKSIKCRAWDAGSNTQPAAITWNVMGMGNNAVFTVRITQSATAEGGVALRFEHPTEPGALKGGWMGFTPGGWSPEAAPLALPAWISAPGGGAAAAALPPPPPPPPPAAGVPPSKAAGAANGVRQITMGEVEKHASEHDCWVVIAGKVYDTTRFHKLHPGGGSSIFINAGTDTTEEFEAIHSKRAWKQLDEFYIGELSEAAADAPPTPSHAPPPPAVAALTPMEHAAVAGPSALEAARSAARAWDGPGSLDARKRLPFPLVQRTVVSHNTLLLRFGLPSAQHVLGLPVGQHVFVSATVAGRLVMRAYTPTSTNSDKGFFELLIKVYRAGTDPMFPLGGAMSQHLDGLAVGQCIEAKGPLGHIEYLGRGQFDLSGALVCASRVAMVAGGTGITPMYQLLRAMLSDAGDTTRCWLLFANRGQEDILLRAELDAMAATHPGRLTVTHTLSAPPPGWGGACGRISLAAVAQHLPPWRDGSDAYPAIAFLCGPGGMQEAAQRHLFAQGYEDNRVLTF